MRLLHDRRGIEFMQWVLLLFFALLLIVAIILLSMETKRLEVKRPQLGKDLVDQRAHTWLVSLLRSRADGEQTMRGMNIADLIIIDEDKRHDDALVRAIAQNIPDTSYLQLTITYPGGRQLLITNLDLKGPATFKIKELGGTSTTYLPGKSGNIQVFVLHFDRAALEGAANIKFTPGDPRNLTLSVTENAGVPIESMTTRQRECAGWAKILGQAWEGENCK